MKKKVFVTALMCLTVVTGNAQTYGYDDYVRFPTMDLYDPSVMNMAVRAQAEMAARRQEMFRFYASRTIDAYKAQRWYDVIENASSTINIDPLGLVFFMRGQAYEALGNYKAALSDYKAGKKDNCPEAASALVALKAKMKEMKKRK